MTTLTLRYLKSQSKVFNHLFRALVVQGGAAVQRRMARLLAPLQRIERLARAYPMRLLKSAMPAVPGSSLRSFLPPCQPDEVMVLEPRIDCRGTLFYFPGCGSERMFSRISMAAIHVMNTLGYRVIVPPPYLCCGYPFHANGNRDSHDTIVLKNTIVFSQIREMFSYLSFDACVVTCGTCLEALEKLDAGSVFGCEVLDLIAFLSEQGFELPPSATAEGPSVRTVLYHAPCHDSLKGRAEDVLKKAGGYQVRSVPHCCSEAGTLALSRPDISDFMLQRKAVAIRDAVSDEDASVGVILTNCPSCLQGLGRCSKSGVQARHVVEEYACRLTGEGWFDVFQGTALRAERVKF